VIGELVGFVGVGEQRRVAERVGWIAVEAGQLVGAGLDRDTEAVDVALVVDVEEQAREAANGSEVAVALVALVIPMTGLLGEETGQALAVEVDEHETRRAGRHVRC
jgi:hypothetical protein